MPSNFFYNPDREVPTFSGDCFVPMRTDPSTQCKHVLGRGDRRLHAVGKPRGGFFVVGRPRPLRAAAFLLGRPPPSLSAKARAREPPSGDCGVYVLEKADGSFYVGKSGNIPERIRQHAAGEGASCARGFVRRVPPLTEETADHEAWERAETLARMHRHGVSRVRGWMYTTPAMSEAHRDHAFRQVCEKMDLCRRCGMGGHFAGACRRSAAAACRPDWAR